MTRIAFTSFTECQVSSSDEGTVMHPIQSDAKNDVNKPDQTR